MGVATAEVIDYQEPFHPAIKFQHWYSSAWITDSVHGRIQTYDRAWPGAPNSIEADSLPIELSVALGREINIYTYKKYKDKEIIVFWS